MSPLHTFAAAAAALTAALAGRPLAAQIDYRNLDAGHPVRTEDAYPIERFAFELVLPYAYENAVGERLHVIGPELSYGLLRNAHVGVALPFAARDDWAGTDWGGAGGRVFGLYNFTTETTALPALALRADVAVPLGALGGDDLGAAVTGIATRSWGRTRAHLNAALGLGADVTTESVEPIPDWAAGLAVDRAFLRRSLLLVGEVAARRVGGDSATEVTAGVGTRWQFTPTVVLDAGIRRRLGGRAGPDFGLTLGLSHVFAVAGLLPAAR